MPGQGFVRLFLFYPRLLSKAGCRVCQDVIAEVIRECQPEEFEVEMVRFASPTLAQTKTEQEECQNRGWLDTRPGGVYCCAYTRRLFKLLSLARA
jgi:hypothetical protein